MTVVDNLDATVPRTARMPKAPVSSVLLHTLAYPRQLIRRLPAPPACLHVRGGLPPAGRVVAIVGARAASTEGCRLASGLAGALARRGYTVVSGGAYGIDAAAHEGALEAGATTFAVLGCGVDVAYPDRHADLFERIAAVGGLLSEHPDGTRPKAAHFPARNRLIAALAEVVIVVEAGFRSGALSTAAWGRKLGVPVLAVPGSAGTDALLSKGRAGLVRPGPEVVQDVLDHLAGRPPIRAMELARPGPAEPTSPVLAALEAGASSAQEVARRLSRPLGEVMGLLSEAELAGRVRRLPGAQYEVTRAH
jgi:DNA processing protein